jgi:glycogen debranching enzyme
MDPERLNAGWGVRTLSKSAVAYNPFDYQTGAIWPHDSAMVAVGLRTYRFDDEALEILTGLYEAATRFDLYRLPELFAGFDRDTYGRPVRYPVACSPQAWAAGSLPYLLTAVLGIVPDAFASTLHIVRPRLPGWLDWVEIKGLTIGASHVDLRFERSEELTLAVVTSKSPDVQVKIEY